MTRVELPHDKGRFGPLRAAGDGRPELVRLVALILAFADEEDRAPSDAAALVLARLEGLALYWLDSQGDAQAVGPSQRFNILWEDGYSMISPDEEPEENFRRGPAGAMQAMRVHLVGSQPNDPACPRAGWDTYECARLAMLRSQAVALFPEVFGQGEAVQAPALQAKAQKVEIQPPGGSWPHQEGEPWLPAERAAMFKMRHLHKWSGPELAKLCGVSRQRVEELIGPAKVTQATSWPKDWQPDAALLRECGFKVSPLQALADIAVNASR